MFNLTPWSGRKVPVHREREQHYPVYSLQREINKLFEDFFRAPMWEGFGESSALSGEQFFGEVTPRVDMSETDKEILIKVELPGMTDKDIDISVGRDLLTISGEKKQEKEQNEKGWYRMERQYGSFSRSIPLPSEIETDKAEAEFKNGVLCVKLPKSTVQQKATKNIQVKSS
jgi:HSP20 family protein